MIFLTGYESLEKSVLRLRTNNNFLYKSYTVSRKFNQPLNLIRNDLEAFSSRSRNGGTSNSVSPDLFRHQIHSEQEASPIHTFDLDMIKAEIDYNDEIIEER